ATAFDSNPADTVRPAGLLNGVTPITPATGSGVTAIAADLGAMAAAMANAGVDPEGMIIVASPRQAITLRLLSGPNFDYEIFGSVGLPDKTVAAFARNSVGASFEDTPAIEMSREVTLHLANPASPLLAAPTGSMFQTQNIALKLKQRAVWAVVASGGVQVVN